MNWRLSVSKTPSGGLILKIRRPLYLIIFGNICIPKRIANL